MLSFHTKPRGLLKQRVDPLLELVHVRLLARIIAQSIERLQYRLLLSALVIQCFLEPIGTLCTPTKTLEFIFRRLLCTHATIKFGSVLVVVKLRLEALLLVLFVNEERIAADFLVLITELLFVAVVLTVLLVDELLVATALAVFLVDQLLIATALTVLLVDKFLVATAFAVLLVDQLLIAAALTVLLVDQLFFAAAPTVLLVDELLVATRLSVLIVQLRLVTVLSSLVLMELRSLGFIVEFCCGLLKVRLASDQGNLPGFQSRLLLMLLIEAVSG